jgi:hypothetical protein
MRRALRSWTITVATEEEMTMHARHPAGLRAPLRTGATTTTERHSSWAARRERERLVEAVRLALARARASRRPRSR